MKVYMVTSGENDDYRVCGVFSTEVKAQSYINILSKADEADFNEITELVIDEGVAMLDIGLLPYSVYFEPNGTIRGVQLLSTHSIKEGIKQYQWGFAECFLWATDEGQAAKLARIRYQEKVKV